MRVLLLRDIAGVGDEGEAREVSDGYARNFLFPTHAAVPVTEEALRAAKVRAAARQAESERELHKIQALASRVDGQELSLRAAATASGKLYGGVGAVMIANGLHSLGFDVRDAWVSLPQPIREIGTHDVRLQFPHGLEAGVTLIIEPEVR